MVQISIEDTPHLFTIRVTTFEALVHAIVQRMQTSKILPILYFDTAKNAFVPLKDDDVCPLRGKTHVKLRLSKSDRPRYEGELNSNGEKHGYGVYKWPSGRMYKGQWSDNMMHGDGTEVWPSGSKYRGQYQSNQRHGQGVFTWADGRVYTGEYVNDYRHGHGVCEFPNGYRYEGQWCQGQKHGHGTETFPDGRRYSGMFLEDKALGLAT